MSRAPYVTNIDCFAVDDDYIHWFYLKSQSNIFEFVLSLVNYVAFFDHLEIIDNQGIISEWENYPIRFEYQQKKQALITFSFLDQLF